jgi:hypothetical protein
MAAALVRGGTEYVIAWFPLGGFVKMLGENPGTTAKEIAMAETPAAPEAAAAAAPSSMSAQIERTALTVKDLLEAGVHFGHQTRRWNPRMKRFLFGERNGVHIVDLDQTLPRFQKALDFLRETVAAGGKVLFVSTKRQAQAFVEADAQRCRAVLRVAALARRHADQLQDGPEVDRALQGAARAGRRCREGGRDLEEGAVGHQPLDREVQEVARRHQGDDPAARRAVHHRRRPRVDRR